MEVGFDLLDRTRSTTTCMHRLQPHFIICRWAAPLHAGIYVPNQAMTRVCRAEGVHGHCISKLIDLVSIRIETKQPSDRISSIVNLFYISLLRVLYCVLFRSFYFM